MQVLYDFFVFFFVDVRTVKIKFSIRQLANFAATLRNRRAFIHIIHQFVWKSQYPLSKLKPIALGLTAEAMKASIFFMNVECMEVSGVVVMWLQAEWTILELVDTMAAYKLQLVGIQELVYAYLHACPQKWFDNVHKTECIFTHHPFKSKW